MAPVAMVVSNHAQVKLERRSRMDTLRWQVQAPFVALLLPVWPVPVCASSSSSLMGDCFCRCRLVNVDIDAEMGQPSVLRQQGSGLLLRICFGISTPHMIPPYYDRLVEKFSGVISRSSVMLLLWVGKGLLKGNTTNLVLLLSNRALPTETKTPKPDSLGSG